MSEGTAGAVRRLTVKNPRVEFRSPGVHEEQVFFDVCTRCEKAHDPDATVERCICDGTEFRRNELAQGVVRRVTNELWCCTLLWEDENGETQHVTAMAGDFVTAFTGAGQLLFERGEQS